MIRRIASTASSLRPTRRHSSTFSFADRVSASVSFQSVSSIGWKSSAAEGASDAEPA